MSIWVFYNQIDKNVSRLFILNKPFDTIFAKPTPSDVILSDLSPDSGRLLQFLYRFIKKAILSDGFHFIIRFDYFTFTSSTSKINHAFGGITPPAPLSP